jgi:hypothetical protein
MSSFRFRQTPAHADDPATVVLRLGTLVTGALVVTVLVNLFAGGLVFVTGLTTLAAYAALHATPQPRRPSRARRASPAPEQQASEAE